MRRGRGDDGQLGHPRTGLVTVPRVIEALQGIKIVALAARGSHCLALSLDCQLYSWGRGDEGQLGQGRAVGNHDVMPALVSMCLCKLIGYLYA
jgi:alpha-tubulin suppressor-like RCC1 family protein